MKNLINFYLQKHIRLDIKISIFVLILALNFNSLTKADDIRDFEIEGISIGDSLLDHFSKNTIKKSFESVGSKTTYTDDSFLYVSIPLINKTYQKIGVHHKKNDKKYTAHSISGVIFFDDFNNCLAKQKEIANDIGDLLDGFKKEKYVIDKNATNGERKIIRISFKNDKKDVINVDCTNWSEELIFDDNLRIDLMTNEFDNWLSYKAYK